MLSKVLASLCVSPSATMHFSSINGDPGFPGCPPEWLSYRDKCYFFSKDLHNFDDAKTTCVLMSASLLIINDKEEQVSVDGLFFF